jgi:hypothetical protein
MSVMNFVILHASIISSIRCVETCAVIVTRACSLYEIWELGHFEASGQVDGHRCLVWKGRQSRKCMHKHAHCGKIPVRIVMMVVGSAADPHSVDICYVRDCRIMATVFR